MSIVEVFGKNPARPCGDEGHLPRSTRQALSTHSVLRATQGVVVGAVAVAMMLALALLPGPGAWPTPRRQIPPTRPRHPRSLRTGCRQCR